ncbi:MAG: GNAT family protein [Clostridia bacterium]
MDTRFLFSNFPFLSDEKMTLSQLYITDEDYLNDILKQNNFNYDANYHIQMSEHGFRNKRYVELGYYKNEKPNLLLGTLNMTNIDEDLQSVQLEVLPNYDELESAKLAVNTLLDFLFNQINVKRVYAKKINACEKWQDIFEDNNFVFEGILRQSALIPQTLEIGDIYIYGKLDSEHIKKGDAEETAFDDTDG